MKFSPFPIAIFGFWLPLLFLDFGAAQLLAPFQTSGGQIYRALAVSAVCGALIYVLAATWAKTRVEAWRGAALGAFAWALWGFRDHFQNAGRFELFLPAQTSAPAATSIWFANAISVALCVAFALILSAAATWAFARFLGQIESATESKTETENALVSFRSALSFPVVVAAIGVFAASILAIPTQFLPQIAPFDLPASPVGALLCGVAAFLGFGAAGFGAARWFGAQSALGFLVAPPLAVAFCANLFLGSSGQIALLEPFSRLIWGASPLEIAALGAFGASLGRVLALKNRK